MRGDLQPSSGDLPDLRLPVGVFFTIAALILLASAFLMHPDQSLPSVSRHANLYVGSFLLVFGLIMTFFGFNAKPELDAGPSDAAAGDPTTPPHSAQQETKITTD